MIGSANASEQEAKGLQRYDLIPGVMECRRMSGSSVKQENSSCEGICANVEYRDRKYVCQINWIMTPSSSILVC
jgi:hypothetical protein